MNPGPELNALVAEKVMGELLWEVWFKDHNKNLRPYFPNGESYAFGSKEAAQEHNKSLGGVIMSPAPEPYSQDISAAWDVVEKLKTRKDYVDCKFTDDPQCYAEDFLEKSHSWYASFCLGNGIECCGADTLPEAICLAALKAVGYELKE